MLIWYHGNINIRVTLRAQVRGIAQKYRHRIDMELVYPKSYWNKNRIAAANGDAAANSEVQKLYVDVKAADAEQPAAKAAAAA